MLINLIFRFGGTIKLDTYKEIIYRDNIIKDKELTPQDYIIFHKFNYEDRYNDSYTAYLGVLVDLTDCYFREVSKEARLILDKE